MSISFGDQIELNLLLAISFIIGLVLLLLGRRVFWALAAVTLAVVGIIIVTFVLNPSALQVTETAKGGLSFDLADESISTIPAAISALVGGVIGIFLTIRFPKVASAIVGFFGGAFILFVIFELFAFDMPEWVRRSLFIIFGALVAIIAQRQPAETMIILTTIVGASILVQVSRLDVNSPVSAFAWLILMFVGIIFQMNTLRVQQRRAAAGKLVPAAPLPPTAT